MTNRQLIKSLKTGIALREEKLKGFYSMLEHLTESEIDDISDEIEDTRLEIDYLKTVLKILREN